MPLQYWKDYARVVVLASALVTFFSVFYFTSFGWTERISRANYTYKKVVQLGQKIPEWRPEVSNCPTCGTWALQFQGVADRQHDMGHSGKYTMDEAVHGALNTTTLFMERERERERRRRELLASLLHRRLQRMQTSLGPRCALHIANGVSELPVGMDQFPGGLNLSVEFTAEFGYEVMHMGMTFPYTLLGAVKRTRGCGHMQSYYWFSPQHQDVESCRRTWRPLNCCVHDMHHHRKYTFQSLIMHQAMPPLWAPPPTMEYYMDHNDEARLSHWFAPDASVVVISNKYTSEWGHGPTNYINISSLKTIIDLCVLAGNIVVYNRPAKIFPDDGQKYQFFADKHMIRQLRQASNSSWHGQVHLLEEFIREDSQDYNMNTMQVFALANCFVSVQGGTSYLSAMFGGHQIILHTAGAEILYSYKNLFPLLGVAETIKVVRSASEIVDPLRSMLSKRACVRSKKIWGGTSPPLSWFSLSRRDLALRYVRAFQLARKCLKDKI